MNSRLTSPKITRSDRDNNSKPNSNKQYQTNIHKPSGILIQLQRAPPIHRVSRSLRSIFAGWNRVCAYV
jgi:hypothetical protein